MENGGVCLYLHLVPVLWILWVDDFNDFLEFPTLTYFNMTFSLNQFRGVKGEDVEETWLGSTLKIVSF